MTAAKGLGDMAMISLGIIVLSIVGVVAAALLLTAAHNRRQTARTEPRTCQSCMQSHPPFAQFCTRCGKKL